MGMDCPNGHGHQPFVGTITIDGEGAYTADRVIARKLGCGCTVGSDEFAAMQKTVNDINVAAAKDIQRIRNKAAADRQAAWAAIRAPKEDA